MQVAGSVLLEGKRQHIRSLCRDLEDESVMVTPNRQQAMVLPRRPRPRLLIESGMWKTNAKKSSTDLMDHELGRFLFICFKHGAPSVCGSGIHLFKSTSLETLFW